jgi:hypothetical protein
MIRGSISTASLRFSLGVGNGSSASRRMICFSLEPTSLDHKLSSSVNMDWLKYHDINNSKKLVDSTTLDQPGLSEDKTSS